MKQLALDLGVRRAPTLDNFVAGANGELVVLLRAFAAGAGTERFVYLWGEPGSGRSHLLEAVAAAAAARGARACYLDAGATRIEREALAAAECIAIDNVEQLDGAAQLALFGAYNALRAGGGALIASGPAAPAQLALRGDVVTRLAWGLVFRVHPLSDDDKAQALAQHAAGLGLRLPQEVIDYLLRHARRDLPALIAIVDGLDRFSLESKRPVTLPLLKELLQETARAPG